MKRIRKMLTGVLCLSVGSMGLVSCMKDSPAQLQAVGDVIVQDMKTDGGVKYSLIVYVTANFEILSGKVTAPGTGGKVYQLTPLAANKYQCVYSPQPGDYTSAMPAKGDYSLEVSAATGETLYGKDAVGDEKLAPIVIKSAELSPSLLKIKWDKVTDADAYIVRLYTADKSKIIFTTSYLGSDVTEYSVGSSTSGWATGESPVEGTNYVVELLGVLVEADVSTDLGSNLQFITTDSKTIKWQ